MSSTYVLPKTWHNGREYSTREYADLLRKPAHVALIDPDHLYIPKQNSECRYGGCCDCLTDAHRCATCGDYHDK